nr:MAG TPA: hypothetical protein [Caudoviricetes sp.]
MDQINRYFPIQKLPFFRKQSLRQIKPAPFLPIQCTYYYAPDDQRSRNGYSHAKMIQPVKEYLAYS